MKLDCNTHKKTKKTKQKSKINIDNTHIDSTIDYWSLIECVYSKPVTVVV